MDKGLTSAENCMSCVVLITFDIEWCNSVLKMGVL